jgi:hypothetical protein
MLVRPTVCWLLYAYCTDSYLVYNFCSVVHYCTAKQKGRETVVQTSAAIIYAETDLSLRIQCSTTSDTTCAILVEYRKEQYRTADRAEYRVIVIMKTTLWYSVVYPCSVIGNTCCTVGAQKMAVHAVYFTVLKHSTVTVVQRNGNASDALGCTTVL